MPNNSTPPNSRFQSFIVPILQSFKIYPIFSILVLFFIYNLTICPTIYWKDSPEFSNAAHTFGIGHPAGFPSYLLISKIFTMLPFSTVAIRVNFVSLFFAVATGIVSFFVISDLIKICFKEKQKEHLNVSAALAVLILGFASSFWWMATIPELYTLNCFFVAVFFLVSLKWYQRRETKLLLLAAFILGIASSVYGANLLFLPVCIVFYLLFKEKKTLNNLFLTSAFFLLGYSINLYLPLRSLINPPLDWGNPETFSNFIAHITDKKDSASHFVGIISPFSFYKNIITFTKIAVSELTLIGLLFTFVGVICHFKKDNKSFTLFGLIALINTLFFMTDNKGYLYLVSYLIFSFWIGLGIYTLVSKSRGYIFNFNYKNLVIPLTIVFVIFSITKDYAYNDKSYYHLPRDHAKEMYLNVDQKALIFTYGYYFHFRYLKDIEFIRPDVTVILLSDLLRPDLFDPVTQERFPMINFPQIESKRENQHQFIQSLISENIRNIPVYWDFKEDLTKYNYPYLLPGIKFLMRFKGQIVEKIPDELLENYFVKLKSSMLKELDDEHFFLDQSEGIRSYYYSFLIDFTNYLMKKKMYNNALPFLELAASITDPRNEEVLNLKGLCYLHLGNLGKAENIFTGLFKNNKEYFEYNYNLALLYYAKGKLEKAIDYAKAVTSLNKDFIKIHYLLGLIYERKKDYNQAIEKITYAVENTSFIPDKKIMQDALKRVKKLKENINVESKIF